MKPTEKMIIEFLATSFNRLAKSNLNKIPDWTDHVPSMWTNEKSLFVQMNGLTFRLDIVQVRIDPKKAFTFSKPANS